MMTSVGRKTVVIVVTIKNEFQIIDDIMDWVTSLLVILGLTVTTISEETCDKTNEVRDCQSDLERTFVAFKPDAVQRGLVGEILSRFEKKGFQLVAMSMVSPDRDLLETHYEEHRGKAFFEPLIEYMLSGPIVATVWEGRGVVTGGRSLLGATNPLNAAPGTIRGDLGLDPGRNLCHASDSVNSANREINLWFSKNQLIHWKSDLSKWIYE